MKALNDFKVPEMHLNVLNPNTWEIHEIIKEQQGLFRKIRQPQGTTQLLTHQDPIDLSVGSYFYILCFKPRWRKSRMIYKIVSNNNADRY